MSKLQYQEVVRSISDNIMTCCSCESIPQPTDLWIIRISPSRKANKCPKDPRKEILIEQRQLLMDRMNEMQKTLDILNHKIEVYEKAVLKKEKEMIQAEEVMAGD